MVFSDGYQKEENRWEALNDKIREHLERYHRDMAEIALMLEQSQLEVSKIAQRNASANAQLLQIHERFDTISRADIKVTYDNALEAQQRLFVMRGQIEKLQSDKNHMIEGVAILEEVVDLFDAGKIPEAHVGSPSTISETLDMLIQAQESERQNLSRQMHDGPAQALSNFILQTEIAVRLFDIDQAKAREELSDLMSTATSVFQQIRDFIFELRPMMLDDLGVTPTLKRYVEAKKEKSLVDIQLKVMGTERRFESYLEVMIFRAIQELVGNAIRHSQATVITVKIDTSDTTVQVSVEDNGKGVDMETVEEDSGMGLKVIKDRLEMLGGYFNLESSVEDGTRISFEVPAEKSAVIE